MIISSSGIGIGDQGVLIDRPAVEQPVVPGTDPSARHRRTSVFSVFSIPRQNLRMLSDKIPRRRISSTSVLCQENLFALNEHLVEWYWDRDNYGIHIPLYSRDVALTQFRYIRVSDSIESQLLYPQPSTAFHRFPSQRGQRAASFMGRLIRPKQDSTV